MGPRMLRDVVCTPDASYQAFSRTVFAPSRILFPHQTTFSESFSA